MFENATALYYAYMGGFRPTLHFTQHAKERARQMVEVNNMAPHELEAAVSNPSKVLWSVANMCVLLEAGRVTVPVCVDEAGQPFVKTVLWSTAKDWKASYETGDVPGRERRY